MAEDSPTKKFRRQHRDLMVAAQELSRAALRPGHDATRIQVLLRRFVGKLRVHAAMETEALYPALLDHSDAQIREDAQRLHEDLAPLYGLVDELLLRWASAADIEARRIRFRIELTRVLAKLGWRMRRENRELYPMADALLGAAWAGPSR